MKLTNLVRFANLVLAGTLTGNEFGTLAAVHPARVVNGRYTARTDEPFVVFLIGMWLPLHKDPAALGRRLIRPRRARAIHAVPTF